MIAAGKGSIINFGSNSWWQATGGMPVYTSAKAAVHGMTRSFARDLGPHRIQVNTVVPGWVMTERQKGVWVTPEALERHRKRQCLPDLIEPATSPAWCSSLPPTTPPCARQTTIWWRPGRSECGHARRSAHRR
jgi:NAD(P)-dependent dehydrogenase (short-subunit alcohol dehydrogenase family)